MTTLPQTTNVRLPRPAQGAIQAGGGGGMLAPSGGAGTQPQSGNEAWRVIRAHIWMIVIVTVILSPAAGFGVNWYLKENYPRYTATGYIQVQPQVNPNEANKVQFQQADPGTIALEVRTQAKYLKADGLLSKLLTNPNSELRKTQWFRQFNGDIRRAKADFDDSVDVTPVQDTKLVRVEFTYSKPEDCKTIVQELISTHLEDQKRQQTESLLDRTSMLNNIKIKAEMRLKDLTSEMKQKSIQLNLEGGGIGRIGIKEIELSKLAGELIDAQLDMAKARAAFEATKSAMENNQDPPGMEVIMYQLNPQLMNDAYQLKQTEIQCALLLEQVGPENPRYKAMLKQAEILRQGYEQALADAKARAKVMILERYQQDYNAAENKLASLTKRVEALKQDLGDLSNSMMTYFTLKDEERGLREQLKQVKEQIDNVMSLTSSQAAARVVLAGPIEVPMNRSFPKLPMVMGIAIGLGLALSLGAAFLQEAMDQSIRSPRDIAKVGQINLLGIIPDESDDPQSAGARLPVVIFDAPHSVMAESFRHVRTKLQHTASLDTTRSIMVTSPSPGDGKTTVACNLAAGLALNGRRILLVDANFRRPEIHKVFGLPNGQGFSDVLNAVAAFDEVIQETQVPNLAVMSSGPKPMNPTELFESQLLIDFIERALEEFDHVVFDTGPIMVVAEAQAMAPRVDGVISVVRAKTNNRGLLQRMRDELRRNKAEHLGVVLNAVRAQGGGYYRRNIQTYYDYANTVD